MPRTDRLFDWRTVGGLALLSILATPFFLLDSASGQQASGQPEGQQLWDSAGEPKTKPASASKASPEPDTLRALVESDPLQLTDEIRSFVDERVGADLPRQVRLMELQEAIFDKRNGLGITYGASGTYSAAETFDRRSGNCLSFTFLFVALARHLGLEAFFVEVDEVTAWSQRGEVSLSHWHMFAEVEMDNGYSQIDFLPWADRRYRTRRRISESRARAHFYNNVGVEALVSGRRPEALALFTKALELDSTFTPARINMAVGEKRAERWDRAEALLLEALDDEPRNAQAATNLASLYLASGQQEKAGKWLQRREDLLQQNPFHHFRLGLRALGEERATEAKEHFRRAILRQSSEAVFHEQMAEAHARLGEIRKARTSLKRALRLAEEADMRKRLEGRLRDLARRSAADKL